jgi:hypothetical protein
MMMTDEIDEGSRETIYKKALQSEVDRYLQRKTRASRDSDLLDLLKQRANSARKIEFASWVERPLRKAAPDNGDHLDRFVVKWLETDSPDAEKAWKNLFDIFFELDTIRDELENDIKVEEKYSNLSGRETKNILSIKLELFDHYMSVLTRRADTILHQSLKIPQHVKQKKVERLQASIKKNISLIRELRLDDETLIHYKYPDSLLETMQCFIDDTWLKASNPIEDIINKHLPNDPKIRGNILRDLDSELNVGVGALLASSFVITARDIHLIDIFEEFSERLENVKDMTSLSSPNSESSRRNHFVKNWLALMYHWFREPMITTSATVASIFFDEIITPDQVRDIWRKSEKGKFKKRQQSHHNRDN